MFGMAPAVSCTGIIVVSYEFFCSLPHQKYATELRVGFEQQASSSPATARRSGSCMLGWFVLVLYASGERIDAPNPSPVPSPPCSQAMQEYCRLDQKLNLLRVVGW